MILESTLFPSTKEYKKSVKDPAKFWDKVAESFVWKERWTKTLDYNFENADFKWFEGGKLNITENVLDRHLEKNGNKTALIWEPNNPLEETRIITYRQLHSKVCQFANVLKIMESTKAIVCVFICL